jgi:hypothetical protein
MEQDFMHKDKYSLTRWKPIDIDDLIRLGRPEDGGYVISRRCVEESRVLISFGISEDWSFDEAFLRANRSTTGIGIDGSVSAKVFLSRAVTCIKRALSAVVEFRLGYSAKECRAAAYWLRKSVQFRWFYDGRKHRFHKLFVSNMRKPGVITWSDLYDIEPRLAPTLNNCPGIFIKMDIEGSEYQVLPDLVVDESKINGLAVEFHGCDINWNKFSTIMDQLSKYFVVVHVHGNNCEALIPHSTTPRVLEISFLNRRLLPDHPRETMAQYPRLNLDRPCDPAKPDHPIYF